MINQVILRRTGLERAKKAQKNVKKSRQQQRHRDNAKTFISKPQQD